MKVSKSIVAFGIGGILLLGGLFALYSGYFGQSLPTPFSPQSVNSAPPVAVTASEGNSGTPTPEGSSLPVAINIPDASINIPVEPGYYNMQTKKWTLGPNSAYFAMMSVKPNPQAGNTYIYGHYRASVFARLSRVHTGSLVTLTTENGKTYTYRYSHRITADPNDSTVLSFSGAPRLTLQTCSGAFFQNRSLYVFDLVGENHA